MSNDNVVVKFTQSWRGYSKGESAGFSPEQSQALIDGKVAVLSKGEKAKGAGAPAPNNTKKVAAKSVVVPEPPAGGEGNGADADAGGEGGDGASDDEGKP